MPPVVRTGSKWHPQRPHTPPGHSRSRRGHSRARLWPWWPAAVAFMRGVFRCRVASDRPGVNHCVTVFGGAPGGVPRPGCGWGMHKGRKAKRMHTRTAWGGAVCMRRVATTVRRSVCYSEKSSKRAAKEFADAVPFRSTVSDQKCGKLEGVLPSAFWVRRASSKPFRRYAFLELRKLWSAAQSRRAILIEGCGGAPIALLWCGRW